MRTKNTIWSGPAQLAADWYLSTTPTLLIPDNGVPSKAEVCASPERPASGRDFDG
ncbi:MAG: hypothetical protein HY791_24215 [Deltaproteobacteria bacterium]|nr:hypothetical protein [Deltaproteobacteria bacterium]